MEAAVEEAFGYYAFPEEHWRRICTNNPLERILREIRRHYACGRGAPTANRP
jgi:transposase-like protein